MSKCVFCTKAIRKGNDLYCSLADKKLNKDYLVQDGRMHPYYPTYTPRWCPVKKCSSCY